MVNVNNKLKALVFCLGWFRQLLITDLT